MTLQPLTHNTFFFKQKVKQAIKHALRSEELSRCPDESGFTRNDK